MVGWGQRTKWIGFLGARLHSKSPYPVCDILSVIQLFAAQCFCLLIALLLMMRMMMGCLSRQQTTLRRQCKVSCRLSEMSSKFVSLLRGEKKERLANAWSQEDLSRYKELISCSPSLYANIDNRRIQMKIKPTVVAFHKQRCCEEEQLLPKLRLNLVDANAANAELAEDWCWWDW